MKMTKFSQMNFITLGKGAEMIAMLEILLKRNLEKGRRKKRKKVSEREKRNRY